MYVLKYPEIYANVSVTYDVLALKIIQEIGTKYILHFLRICKISVYT